MMGEQNLQGQDMNGQNMNDQILCNQGVCGQNTNDQFPVEVPCELVEDLLPSYVEGLVGDVTKKIVDNHLQNCEKCTGKFRRMAFPLEEKNGASMDNGKVYEANEREKKEIDFLKKTRKKIRRGMLFGLLAFLFAIGIYHGSLTYLLAEPINVDSLAYAVTVEQDLVNIKGAAVNYSGIKSVNFKEEDGVVCINVDGARKALLYSSDFDESFQTSEQVQQVVVGDNIVWSKGEKISLITSKLYQAYNPYIGNMPADFSVTSAMGMTVYTGNFTNELQTKEEPYGWTLNLEADFVSRPEEQLKDRLRSYAYGILAGIGNLDSVTFNYRMAGDPHSLTITAAEASEYAGSDIKAVGQDINLLEALMLKSGLADSFREVYTNEAGEQYVPSEEGALVIRVANFAEDTIYGLGVTVEKEPIMASEGMCHANETPLVRGELITFRLLEEDFQGGSSDMMRQASVTVSVGDEQQNMTDALNTIVVNLDQAREYRVVLSGNAIDGYTLSD